LIQQQGSTGIFILICIIIIALIIDISTLSIATSIGGLRPSYITLFVGLVVVFVVGQYYILAFVKCEYKDREYKVSSRVTGPHIIDRAVTISQYALLAILASVILQMVFTSSYHVFSLKAIIFINSVSIISQTFLFLVQN